MVCGIFEYLQICFAKFLYDFIRKQFQHLSIFRRIIHGKYNADYFTRIEDYGALNTHISRRFYFIPKFWGMV